MKKKFKILLVDDERDMCRMVSSILKEEGYRADMVYDAGQALKKIAASEYDLMIVDYKLPDMNGIDFLAEVRRTKPALKAIMISAYGSPSIKAEAKKIEVYRFLDKPFDLNRLLKVIKGALANKSQGEVDRSSKGTVPDLRTKRSKVVESGLSLLLKRNLKMKGGERKWQ